MSSPRKTIHTKKNQPTRSSSPWLFAAAGAVLLAALVFAGVLLFNGNGAAAMQAPANSLPDEIAVADAFQKREAGAFMLDVRELEEWDEYHMPGATLIPLAELADRVGELPHGREIVVVCRSGNRSATGRDVLLEAGFTQVTSMAGGMKEWRSAGYPVVSGQ